MTIKDQPAPTKTDGVPIWDLVIADEASSGDESVSYDNLPAFTAFTMDEHIRIVPSNDRGRELDSKMRGSGKTVNVFVFEIPEEQPSEPVTDDDKRELYDRLRRAMNAAIVAFFSPEKP